MDWMRMCRVLIGRRRLMAAVVGVLLSAGVALVLLLPNRYTATAAVLVDLNQSDPLAAMSGNAAAASPASVTGALSTQIDLLASSRVLLRALQSLRAAGDELADERELWLRSTGGQGDYDAWWVERLREDLVVKPTRESGVITLSVTVEDRAGAARAAKAVLQAYLDTVLELRVEPARQYSRFFEERAAALRHKLAEAQAQLADYQRRQGVVGTGERLDMENLRLLELSSQLTAQQAASVDSSEREAQARRQAGGADRMREVSTHPVIVGLAGQLAQQQARLGELGARLGDNHPLVIEAQAAVAQLRSRLESESARVAAGLGLASRVDEGRVAQLRQAVQAQRERVLRLKSGTDAAAVLEREVQAAQRAYDAVLAQGARAQLESQAHQAHVAVLQQPTVPARPSAPKVGTILAVVAFFALLLSAGAALFAEQRDARVRAAADIRETLRLPLLVSLPPLGSTKRAKSTRPPQAPTRSWRGTVPLPGLKA
ncbi:MAG: chain length determinant protein EpsF [Burkholderiales bacterium]|nr:chain length determinant protein EpsF [Burkholderiales bacterium]